MYVLYEKNWQPRLAFLTLGVSLLLILGSQKNTLKSFRESRCIHLHKYLKQLYGLSKNSGLLRFDYIWCRRIHRSKTTKKKLFKRKCSFDRSIFFSGMRKNMNPLMKFEALGMKKNENLFSQILHVGIIEILLTYMKTLTKNWQRLTKVDILRWHLGGDIFSLEINKLVTS